MFGNGLQRLFGRQIENGAPILGQRRFALLLDPGRCRKIVHHR
jgi:hypothetical protein